MKPTPMDETSPEMIAKLPKWAQALIKSLDTRAVLAERALKENLDSKTPSEFYYEEHTNGELQKHYLQTNKVMVERDGLAVRVLVRHDDPGVEVTFWDETHTTYQVPVIPHGNGTLRIMLKKDLK